MPFGDDAADREAEPEALELFARDGVAQFGELVVRDRKAVVLDFEDPSDGVGSAAVFRQTAPDLAFARRVGPCRMERILEEVDRQKLEFERFAFDRSAFGELSRDAHARMFGARTERRVGRLDDFAEVERRLQVRLLLGVAAHALDDARDAFGLTRDFPGSLVDDGVLAPTVLGADDKSAIANVMTAMDIVVRENRPHGDIYVCFVPDEELGEKGARKIDFSKFPVDFAYTIDCCELGEVVWETFNAGNAVLRVKGIPAHPMSAKGVMVNPILVVHDFLNMLDRTQTPECTELREGFVVLKTMQANPTDAVLTMKIRDHSRALYERKKEQLRRAADYLQFLHPKAEVSIELSDAYANIGDSVTPENRQGIDNLYRACELCGVEAKTVAMRGGTDGSFISTKGILTPNYFTGAHNFHSNCEFLPMKSWEKSLEVTLALVALAACAEH